MRTAKRLQDLPVEVGLDDLPVFLPADAERIDPTHTECLGTDHMKSGIDTVFIITGPYILLCQPTLDAVILRRDQHAGIIGM